MDNLERGFINKDKILEYVSEEEIFKLVFGYTPVEHIYVVSPFRVDSSPGCWFSSDPVTGKLRFVDFGNSDVIDGISMHNIDCFDAVQVYFGLGNFYRTMEFIKEKLIDGKDVQHNIRTIRPKKEKKSVEIHIDAKEFDSRDGRYWSKYGVTKQQLIDDKVFSVKRFSIKNGKFGDMLKRVYDPCYAYTGFDQKRKKLYRPLQEKGSKKFLTNCRADDIGELWQLPTHGDLLVISKSYKDCRVLRNQGIDSIWLQNEGMIPYESKLTNICRRFRRTVVFFDNDETGIEASLKVTDIINRTLPGRATNLYLPERLLTERGIKDPADVYRHMGQKQLMKFLKENLTTDEDYGSFP